MYSVPSVRPSFLKRLFRALFSISMFAALSLLCAGCGGGGGSTLRSPGTAPEAGSAPVPETATGVVTLKLDYEPDGDAAKQADRSAVTAIPGSAVRFLVHVLDDAGIDVIPPVTAPRTPRAKNQIVNIPGVPIGTYTFLVAMYADNGDLVGFSPQVKAVVGASAATELKVTSAVTLTALAVTPPVAEVAVGTRQSFVATGTFSDGSTTDVTRLASWTSSNPDVAVIDARGRASSARPGTTTIMATCSGRTATATLTVTGARLVSIEVSPSHPHLARGASSQLTATGVFADRTTQDLTAQVTWSSAAPEVATVDARGLVTGMGTGRCEIMAAFQGLSGNATVRVTGAPLVSIAVTPTNPSIEKGLECQFTATATYADKSKQDVTSLVTWTSSDTRVAAISNGGGSDGLALALAAGATTITATDPTSGISGTSTLTVTAAALVSIAVTPTNPSVPLGLTKQFAATGTYSDGSTQDLTTAVTWASSDTAKATISNAAGSEGLATTVESGATTITASAPGTSISGSTTLTVSAPTLVSIGVTPTNPAVPLGLTQQFTATGTYTDNTTQDLTAAVTWSSSDEAKAAISNAAGSQGLATTLGTGSTTISATDAGTGISGSTVLTVSAAALASLAVTPTNPTSPVGLTRQFTATGTYTDGSTQELTGQVTWASSDEGKAAISNASGSEGLATALSTGSATISATVPGTGISASTTFTVTAPELVSIEVTPTNPSVPLGLAQQLTATGTYTDNTTQDLTAQVTWASSDPAKAVVSNASGSEGLATTVAAGSTTVSATLGSVSGSTTFTVTAAALVSIAVAPANPSVPLGLTRQFAATGKYTDNSTEDLTTTVTWSSSDETKATISNASGSEGLATTVATGSTTITATAPGTRISGSTTLDVTAAELVSIAVNPANPSVPLGLTRQFTATGTYTDGSTQDLTAQVTWASSDASKATISNAAGSEGLATTIAAGSASITATHPGTGVSGSTTLTVSPAQLVSIAVTPADSSVSLGLTRQLTATGTYTDGSAQVLTTSVTWASSAPSTATISNAGGTQGLATAVAAGSTTISATDPVSSVSGSTTLTVTAPTLLSITVTPENATIPVGQTRSCTATGSYSDGSSQNLTASASWSSSDTSRATVSNAQGTEGRVTIVASGTATISATVGGVTGSTTVNGARQAMGTDNTVMSIALGPDGTQYIGGGFTRVGPVTGHGVVLDATTGVVGAGPPSINGRVYAVLPDGQGGWYVGGAFTHIGTVARNRVAHILADGTVDPAFDANANGDVFTLALSGSRLYAGGAFTTMGGQTRNYAAAVDATTGSLSAWNPNADYYVYALVVDGPTVYVGGRYATLGGQARNCLAAVDATSGSLGAWNPNPDGIVWALARSGSTLYAGGEFSSIGGQSRRGVAALDLATGLVTAWNANCNRSVYALAVSGNLVYAGGGFWLIGGQSRNRLAALDATTGLATAFNPDASFTVTAIAVNGSTVYAGGQFTTIGGQQRYNIAALDASTGAATGWNPRSGGGIDVIAVSGNSVFAGGDFTTMAVETRNNVAAIGPDGNLLPWNPGTNVNGYVNAIVVSGSTVFVGGGFNVIGGQLRYNIAAVDAATGTVTGWRPDTNGRVYTLALSGSTLYAGGEFQSMGGQTRNYIASVDTATSNVTSWNPNANGFVHSIAVSGTTVHAGGRFTTIGGQSRKYMGAVSASTGLATTFNPNPNHYVDKLLVDGNSLYVGGYFTTISGQSRTRICRFDGTTLTAWNPSAPDGIVDEIAVCGSTVYLGGSFKTLGGQPRNYFGAVDAVTGLATPAYLDVNSTLAALVSDGTSVYAGGGFRLMGIHARGAYAVIDGASGDVIARARPHVERALAAVSRPLRTLLASLPAWDGFGPF